MLFLILFFTSAFTRFHLPGKTLCMYTLAKPGQNSICKQHYERRRYHGKAEAGAVQPAGTADSAAKAE